MGISQMKMMFSSWVCLIFLIISNAHAGQKAARTHHTCADFLVDKTAIDLTVNTTQEPLTPHHKVEELINEFFKTQTLTEINFLNSKLIDDKMITQYCQFTGQNTNENTEGFLSLKTFNEFHQIQEDASFSLPISGLNKYKIKLFKTESSIFDIVRTNELFRSGDDDELNDDSLPTSNFCPN